MQQLSQFVTTGEFNQETHVWKQLFKTGKKLAKLLNLIVYLILILKDLHRHIAGSVSPPLKPDENNTPTT